MSTRAILDTSHQLMRVKSKSTMKEKSSTVTRKRADQEEETMVATEVAEEREVVSRPVPSEEVKVVPLVEIEMMIEETTEIADKVAIEIEETIETIEIVEITETIEEETTTMTEVTLEMVAEETTGIEEITETPDQEEMIEIETTTIEIEETTETTEIVETTETTGTTETTETDTLTMVEPTTTLRDQEVPEVVEAEVAEVKAQEEEAKEKTESFLDKPVVSKSIVISYHFFLPVVHLRQRSLAPHS